MTCLFLGGSGSGHGGRRMPTSEKFDWRIDRRLTSYGGGGYGRTDRRVKGEAGEPFAQARPFSGCAQRAAHRSARRRPHEFGYSARHGDAVEELSPASPATSAGIFLDGAAAPGNGPS